MSGAANFVLRRCLLTCPVLLAQPLALLFVAPTHHPLPQTSILGTSQLSPHGPQAQLHVTPQVLPARLSHLPCSSRLRTGSRSCLGPKSASRSCPSPLPPLLSLPGLRPIVATSKESNRPPAISHQHALRPQTRRQPKGYQHAKSTKPDATDLDQKEKGDMG